jgi:NADPH:quinone reductase-like Zn-dependent oxidoreductase
MKAIVNEKYGHPVDVLQLKEVEKPVPAEHQVLVKVLAASVNISDLAPVRGIFLARLLGTGLQKPKRSMFGADLAGRVDAVGRDVKGFKPGDEVFGASSAAFAEYAIAREDLLVSKPANVSFEAAASVPVAAITALQALRKGQIKSGQKVLVNSASGAVGPFVVQIARSFGAEVTAVCSTRNLDNARSMGAVHVIDYTSEDFIRNGQKYDLIIAANGYHSILAYRNSLTPKGMCVVLGGSLNQIFQSLVFGPLISKMGSRKVIFMGIAKLNQEDLVILRDLLAEGKIVPLIEKRYPLSDVPQALSYIGEGHAQGKVVITVMPTNNG